MTEEELHKMIESYLAQNLEIEVNADRSWEDESQYITINIAVMLAGKTITNSSASFRNGRE